MKVKLCGIRNEEDVEIAVSAGADAVGFLIGQVHPSPDFILVSTAARLVKTLPPFITPVIVTHIKSVAEVIDMVIRTGIRTVQLYGKNSIEELEELREKLPLGSKLIYATHIIDDNIEDGLEDKLPFIDALIIDSFSKDDGRVGGTGKTHNWTISAKIVAKFDIPVILAGGLKIDNVEIAIKTVQPYGVDANSSLKNIEGFRDLEKCEKFVKIVRSVG